MNTITIDGVNIPCYENGGEYLVNLTPHDITIVLGDETINIPASGQLARVRQETTQSGRCFAGIPVSHNEYGEVTGLPNPVPGVGFIVSGQVKSAVGVTRLDVLAPNETVRNADGQIAGARSLGE